MNESDKQDTFEQVRNFIEEITNESFADGVRQIHEIRLGREIQGPKDPGLVEFEDHPAFDLLHFFAWSQLINVQGTVVLNFNDQT